VTTVYVTRDRATSDARVSFTYDATVVELIKSVGPRHRRRWDADAKVWTVASGFASTFVRAARLAGHTVIDDFTSSRRGSGSRADRPRQRTTDWATALFEAVGPERREPVYKALSRVLHPDVGGDTQLMQDLNRAPDQLGRRAA
jgi:hypothetical protein